MITVNLKNVNNTISSVAQCRRLLPRKYFLKIALRWVVFDTSKTKGDFMQRIHTGYYMAAVLLLLVITMNSASAHCEIPCGIYGDEMRFDMISEHITTIEKSMKMIEAQTKEMQIDHNQLVRWINNKENHANEIQNIVCQYFMTQRIKPVEDGDDVALRVYTKQITLLHHMLISAMKAKQTTDHAHIEDLRNLLEEFRVLYFGGKKKR